MQKSHPTTRNLDRKTVESLSGEEWIELIQKNHPFAFQWIYDLYYPKFLLWARKRYYRCCVEDIEDAFQEAVTIFYVNVREKKVTQLWVKIYVYLFAVGKNQLYKKLTDKDRVNCTEALDDQLENNIPLELPAVYQDYHKKSQAHMVQSILANLSKKDRQLLILSYFKHFTFSSIAKNLNIENEVCVRVKKHRLLRKIRHVLLSKNLSSEILQNQMEV